MKLFFLPCPAELGNPMNQFALELVMALATRYPLHGKIDVTSKGDEHFLKYDTADQALSLLTNCQEISLISIKDDHFSLLLDYHDDGIDVTYIPYVTDPAYYEEVFALCRTILHHLSSPAENPSPPKNF